MAIICGLAMQGFSRRQALRIAGSTATTLPLVGQTVASEGEGKRPYTGVSYSTLTHEVQRDGFSSLNFQENSVQGKLNVGGFEIPIGSNESMRTPSSSLDHDKYVVWKTQPKFTEDGKPLKVVINNHPRNINGYLSRSGAFGDLGFTMGPDENDNPGDVRKALPGKGKGVNNGVEQKIPDKGLPEYVPIDEHARMVNSESGGD